jgi:drug/metabolite transporter (DMT)-like permease
MGVTGEARRDYVGLGEDATKYRGVAIVALVGVTAIWGSTFVVVKDAIERMPTLDFLAERFTLAALVMVVARPRSLRRVDRLTLRRGVLLGLVLGGAYIAQTVGLEDTSPAVSGFLTGLFVVLTPLIGATLLRSRLSWPAWVAVLLATAGLALISLRGVTFGIGEALTLVCAFGFALHIVGLSVWAVDSDLWAFAIVQLVTAATLCAAVAAPYGIEAPPDGQSWFALVLTAVFATAIAYAVQTWAQRRLTASQVGVVLTMEPVFAGAFAVAFAAQVLTWPLTIGGAAIVTAMYVAELGSRRGLGSRIVTLSQ